MRENLAELLEAVRVMCQIGFSYTGWVKWRADAVPELIVLLDYVGPYWIRAHPELFEPEEVLYHAAGFRQPLIPKIDVLYEGEVLWFDGKQAGNLASEVSRSLFKESQSRK